MISIIPLYKKPYNIPQKPNFSKNLLNINTSVSLKQQPQHDTISFSGIIKPQYINDEDINPKVKQFGDKIAELIDSGQISLQKVEDYLKKELPGVSITVTDRKDSSDEIGQAMTYVIYDDNNKLSGFELCLNIDSSCPKDDIITACCHEFTHLLQHHTKFIKDHSDKLESIVYKNGPERMYLSDKIHDFAMETENFLVELDILPNDFAGYEHIIDDAFKQVDLEPCNEAYEHLAIHFLMEVEAHILGYTSGMRYRAHETPLPGSILFDSEYCISYFKPFAEYCCDKLKEYNANHPCEQSSKVISMFENKMKAILGDFDKAADKHFFD